MAHTDKNVTQYACEKPVVPDDTMRNIIAIPAVRDTQGRRRVLKSGTAIEGVSRGPEARAGGGESGVWGISLEKFNMSVVLSDSNVF